MAIILDDNDKLIIIIVAATLILITLFITLCVVCPWCLFHRLILKSKQKKKTLLKTSYPSLAGGQQNPESQHFHFSIVPVYGTKTHLQTTSATTATTMMMNDKQHQCNGHHYQSILNNQFENLTNLARLRYSLHSNNNGDNDQISSSSSSTNNQQSVTNVKLPKLEATIYYKSISSTGNNDESSSPSSSSSNIRIHIAIHRIFDLTMNELSIEPSPYVVAILIGGFRLQRKSLVLNKVLQNEMFRTETIRRTLDTRLNRKFISEPLSRNILKDSTIKLRLMHDERYANDVCLGELCIPLKKIQSFEELKQRQQQQQQPLLMNGVDSGDNDSQNVSNDDDDDIESNDYQFQSNVYTLIPIKEIKGEIMMGLCYLPTSRRVNITIIKGTIRNSISRFIDQSTSMMMTTTTTTTSNHQAFYIKALMFHNGKLIRKKKTSLSIRLAWGKDETISFDLSPEESSEQMSLMLILAYKMQDSNSPESPDSPMENTQPPPPSSSLSSVINHQQHKQHSQTNTNSIPLSLTTTTTTTTSNNINNIQKSSKNSARNSLRKESCIGHFVLDRPTWIEIVRKPRKQIVKWYKLF
ncbi:synaptotagmin-2-like protein [Dermatophagoides farinae]|uniref:Synaptotagmin-2-like protein n=1 Tax=Dermatophagoides farinae TaxID=6954 RepID=A0A9D4P4A5_DERFA|nr:synaptotagmin-2-like protein [Dermatophagoides farinae]